MFKLLLTDLDQAKQLHFNDPHLEHKLFPHLFPLAQGGFVQGQKGMTLDKYNHFRLLHVERRWDHDKIYLFFLFDRSMKVQIHAYSQRLWASNRGRKGPLTQGDIVQEGKKDAYYQYGNIMPATVSGSAMYWKDKWLDLVATVQEIGMPHYFVTLKANDSWPQLKACLASVRSVIRPVEATQYFFERFALMKNLLYGKKCL